jgi:hypothetical protein
MELNGVHADAPRLTNEQILDAQVRLVLGTLVRGILTSQGVPPHLLLASIAKQTGEILATAITADLPTTLSLRKQWKDAFTTAVTKAPMQLPPAPMQPQPANVVDASKRRLMG